jgi:hypothetical protein
MGFGLTTQTKIGYFGLFLQTYLVALSGRKSRPKQKMGILGLFFANLSGHPVRQEVTLKSVEIYAIGRS